MILTLLLLAGVGGIAYVVWNYQKKAAAREAASRERFEEMLRARPAAAPAPGAPPVVAPTPGGTSTPGVAPVAKAQAPGAASSARERFLGQRETLLYRLLKAGIPDHEIFANVALASVVGGRNEQEARHLAQYRLDFVVCDKGMKVVAAVGIEPAGGTQSPGEQQFVAECLKAAGIGLVRLNLVALPRREEIRALVCGPSKPSGS